MVKKKLYQLAGIFAIAAAVATTGCKKTIDSIKQDLMIDLITSNTWVVTRFDSAANSLLTQFDGYEFRFEKNSNVRAIKTNQADMTGTWQGSQSTQSITSNFTSASYPVFKLNGVWKVTNTDLSPKLVDAYQEVDGVLYKLRLNAK